MKMIRGLYIALVTSLCTLVGLTILNYLEFKTISEYQLMVTTLGHELVATRDEITLQSMEGISSPYELNRSIVAMEKKLNVLESSMSQDISEQLYFNRMKVYEVLSSFHDSGLEVADALDHLVGVIVARHSVLSSLDRPQVSQNENTLNESVLLEAFLTREGQAGFEDPNINRISHIFNDLSMQQRQLFSIVLSGKNAEFVEHAEHQLSDISAEVRDRVALLLFASTVNVFVILLLVGVQRSRELRRNNSAYQESVEKSEHASQAKSLFLATMSHELRTPMNGVMGLAELIREQSNEIEIKKHAQTIVESGEHLVTLLNDILDFSKIEQGKMTLESCEFSMASVADSIEKSLRPVASNKSIALKIHNLIPSNIELVGDPARLRQILFNVVGNGIKFTESGEVSLSIIHHQGSRKNIEIKVTDTGVGIDRERLNSIFNAFEQAELSTTRKFGGTGLGLSIVKELVNLMDGEIEVFSQPNVGTEVTITLTLPIQVIKQVQVTEPAISTSAEPDMPSTSSPSPSSTDTLRVLIAEDNRLNALVLKEFCHNEGYSVTLARDGSEAIEVLSKEGFDLILMDNHMPKLNGIEVISHIRHQLKLDTCIFACTADVFKEAHDRFIDSGANFVLTKPLQVSSLKRAISRHYAVIRGGQAVSSHSNVVHLIRSPVDTLPMTEEEISSSAILSDGALEREEKLDLLETFIQEVEQNIEKLISGYSESSADKIFHTLHSTKGITAEFGMPEVSQLAEKCEIEARGGTIPALEELQVLVNLLLINVHQAHRLNAEYAGARQSGNGERS
ncbi:ATP-binding protein [Vibrio sp. WXL103]|uniref:ATP-binding protein n=1 Tax=unclassified Vibrio TaxID=2614977 RepID=UPI003EC68202